MRKLGTEQSTVLQVRDLHVQVHNQKGNSTIVQEINFELKCGQVLGLIGQLNQEPVRTSVQN